MFEFGEDKPNDECGVFGIYAPTHEVARLTYYALYALQHRGQKNARIVVSDGQNIVAHKGLGLVSEVFSDRVVEGLKGTMAIGHVRSSGNNETMMDLSGAYALVILAEGQLIGLRDPHGVRPLCIGRLDHGYCLASESCALSTIGAEFLRDVEPGEIVVIDEEGLHSHQGFSKIERTSCAFEYIHFARSDSTIDQLSVSESRSRMGIELAREYPVEADLVIAVPDSGTASALAYATALGLPYGEGIIRNRYVHGTYTQPKKAMQEMDVRLMLNANASVLKDKRVVMIDDSLVQGTTSSKLVDMVRKAGTKEVHFLISSPPLAHPCCYGIDAVKREKLIATQCNVEAIRKFVGADSLYYLTEQGLLRALGLNSVCLACFNGAHPIPASKVN